MITCTYEWKSLSHVWLFATPQTIYSSWNSPDQNTRVGSLSLLQGIFPTQGLNPGLLHCRWILSHREAQHVHVCMLNHLSRVPLCVTLWTIARQAPLHGTLLARILEWVAMRFSRGSSQPRHQTCLSTSPALAGGLLTSRATCTCICVIIDTVGPYDHYVSSVFKFPYLFPSFTVVSLPSLHSLVLII